MLADLASVEGRLDRQRRAAKGDKSLAAEIAALERAAARAGRRRPDLPVRPRRRRARAPRAGVPAHRQAGARRREHRRGPARRRRRGDRADSRRPRSPTTCSRCACSSRPRPPPLDPEARGELLDGLGLGEGVVPRVARAVLPPARPAHVPHHRRHRVACVDVPRRRPGARVRRRDPLRPAAWLHPRRGDRLAGAARRSARGRRRRNRASCGSRGRTTRSPTATCSRSASTCESVDGAGSYATVTCWPAAEIAQRSGGAAQGAARPRRARRRVRAATRAGRCTRSGCGFRSTSRSATRGGACCARATLAPWRVSRPRVAGRVRGRGGGRRVRAMAVCAAATGSRCADERDGVSGAVTASGTERVRSCWSARRSATSATSRRERSRRCATPT